VLVVGDLVATVAVDVVGAVVLAAGAAGPVWTVVFLVPPPQAVRAHAAMIAIRPIPARRMVPPELPAFAPWRPRSQSAAGSASLTRSEGGVEAAPIAETLSHAQSNDVSGGYDLPGPTASGQTKTIVAIISANKAGNNTINVSVWGSGDFNSGPPETLPPSAVM
jgi:hypothetical protein